MDTKWKTTAKQILAFLLRDGGRLIAGILAAAVSTALFRYLFLHRGKFNTSGAWAVGLIANVFLCAAMWLIVRYLLKRRYRSWMPENKDFYEEWKRQWFHQQRILLMLAAAALIVALLFFNSLMRTYWMNYATGYIAIFTALLQFGVSELAVITFMKRYLDLLMERMAEINQKSVEAAVRSEKMKVDLISNVSHDLKTPLTSMVGYIDLMKKEELNEALSDYVDVLSIKSQKLKEMIDSLFSLAKTSSGNIELKPEPINLNRLVEQIYADMEDKILGSGLEFVTELTAQDTEIITDSAYMYRICQNLMENALKYSASHTRVFLKTAVVRKESAQIVRFEITNTANYRMNFTKDQIVERFARGDEARSGDGNGLGLAIVSTYTSALGGRFDVNIDCDQFKAFLEFDKQPTA